MAQKKETKQIATIRTITPVLNGAKLTSCVKRAEVDGITLCYVEGSAGYTIKLREKEWFVPMTNVVEVAFEPQETGD